MESQIHQDDQLYHAGVQCVVMKDNCILLGRRYNTTDEGTWALPGGHIKFAETAIEAARRELLEETGVSGTSAFVEPGFLTYTTKIPYVHFPVVFREIQDVPRVISGEKFDEISFFSIDKLPSPLFLPTKASIDVYLSNRDEGKSSPADKFSGIKFLRLDLVSIQPGENRNRGYCITLIQEENNVKLIRSWGRRTSKVWRHEIKSLESVHLAIEEIETLIVKRISHGYLLAGAVGDISIQWLAKLFPADAEIKVQAGLLTTKIILDDSFREAYMRDKSIQQPKLFNFENTEL